MDSVMTGSAGPLPEAEPVEELARHPAIRGGDMDGMRLDEMRIGQDFHTLHTDRVGRLLEKNSYGLRVRWRDLRGPETVHRRLRVEPWPRDDGNPGGW
jgi:hypothetical protein